MNRWLARALLAAMFGALLAVSLVVHVRPANGLLLTHAHERVSLLFFIVDCVVLVAAMVGCIAFCFAFIVSVVWLFREARS